MNRPYLETAKMLNQQGHSRLEHACFETLCWKMKVTALECVEMCKSRHVPIAL